MPFGRQPPGVVLRPYAAAALRLNQPVVSEVFVSSVRKQPSVGVAVPVSRDGAASQVLLVNLKLDWFDELRRAGLTK